MILEKYHIPQVMGILNCTPDSFYIGSRKQEEKDIAERTIQIFAEGATTIDVGACSTRPGGEHVSEEEELRRMDHALNIIRREAPDAIISIDTYRPVVARMAIEKYDADIINDVSEGCDEMFRLVAECRVPYILMSQQPDTESIIRQFKGAVDALGALGHKDIILDPGFGFGKDVVAGNFRVLNEMDRIGEAFPELPLLAGVSRKRMIWHLLECTAQDEAAMQGTMLVNLLALQKGATILRVHDVKQAADTIKIYKESVSHI